MKKIFILLNLVLFTSCIYRQDRFKERVFYVNFNQTLVDYKDNLVIRGGEIFKLITNKPVDKVIYKLHFHDFRGGATFFLGNKIKESHGYKGKRFSISVNKQVIKEYSINDLSAMNIEKVDTFDIISISL